MFSFVQVWRAPYYPLRPESSDQKKRPCPRPVRGSFPAGLRCGLRRGALLQQLQGKKLGDNIMSKRISASEFARRADCDVKQVRRALARGALARGTDGLIDASMIGQAWRKANRRTLTKGALASRTDRANRQDSGTAEKPAERDIDPLPGMLPLAEALRLKEHYAAMLRKLEYEQREGSLIELAQAEAVVFDVFRAARDAWLAWPSKVAPFIASELGVEVDAVAMLLSEYVYRQLQELGDPQPDFTDR